MANLICNYCDESVDLDTNLEHFVDNEQEICEKQINNLDSIEYGEKTYYHSDGELELVETSDGEFDRDEDLPAHQAEFIEALNFTEEEERNNAKFPER